MKTHWKKLNNPNYIGAYTLDGLTSLVVEIQKVQKEVVVGVDGKKEDCIVAHLKGYKPFILNTTNCKRIETSLGTPHVEDWAGKRIEIIVEVVKAFGEKVEALRVKIDKSVLLPELTPEDTNRWNEAVQFYQKTPSHKTVAAIRSKYKLSTDNEQLLISQAE